MLSRNRFRVEIAFDRPTVSSKLTPNNIFTCVVSFLCGGGLHLRLGVVCSLRVNVRVVLLLSAKK